MSRDYRVCLSDIVQAIRKIEKYTADIDYDEFAQNELIQDAVVRNLEIIGEAVKNVPEEIRKKYPGIEWRKMAGLRDILIHAYFGIDVNIVWDIVKNKIPVIKHEIHKILSETKK